MAALENILDQEDEHKVFSSTENQILAKSGMWLGSSYPEIRDISVLEENQFVLKELEIIPAIAKLIEEIISNSADEHVRTKDKKLRGWVLDRIDISIDKFGHLVVRDNGGITSKIHSSGEYTTEVIFGKLFSSSNYDDTQERTVVGTNGVGSVLTNIFSKSFRVVSSDSINSVDVTWSKNKSIKSEAIVTKCKDHFTLIDAQLDLERFGIKEIPYGIMKYVERLSMILAASNSGLTVSFNGDEYAFDSFGEYVKYYGDTSKMLHENNEHWEIYLSPSDGQSRRYTIVNGAECNTGSHIKHLEGGIKRRVDIALQKLKIDKMITYEMVRNSYNIFMNVKINQPQYSSQSKTELTNEMSYIDKNGEKQPIKISDKFSKDIQSSFIIDRMKLIVAERTALSNSKEFQKKAKELSGKSAKSIRKLLDAGGKTKAERKKCQLWVFEGESAGAGFRVGRKAATQGSYYLKGKCVNSINMSTLKVMNNQEFSDVIVAFGLNPKNPDDLSGIRFGDGIVVATDMDYDGFSIFAQFYTLFAIHYPKVIEAGLLYRSISPLYKVTKGKDKEYFYSKEEYDAWGKKNLKGWYTKFIKGLGGLKPEDYKIMLRQPILERMHLDEAGLQLIHAFMGDDSGPRKRLLEANN